MSSQLDTRRWRRLPCQVYLTQEKGTSCSEPAAADGYRDSNRKSAALVIWGLAWVATLALARFGPEYCSGIRSRWRAGPRSPSTSWSGIGWIVAFTRFLRAVDDLQRKILLDALAVTLGVGWVVGFGYVVADAAGLVTGDIDLAVFPLLLGAVFLTAFVVGRIRYR